MSEVILFMLAASPALVPVAGGSGLVLLAAAKSGSRHLPLSSLIVFSLTVLATFGFCAWFTIWGFPPFIGQSSPWHTEFERHFFVDKFSYGWCLVASLFTGLTGILAGVENWTGQGVKRRDDFAESLSLLLFSMSGASLLITASSLLMVFLGLEFLSLPLYVLVASRKGDPTCCEAGLKYFLFGSFASVILLLSIAVLYGSTGSIYFSDLEMRIGNANWPTSVLAIVLLIAAAGFKVGLPPFHWWLPDAYQGAPAPITGFMGSLVKVAAFAMSLRLFWGPLASQAAIWSPVLESLAIAAMAVGSIGGLVQRNLKRLLAYSSIGHAGYLALGVAVMPQSLESAVIWYYLAVYGLMFIGLFGIVSLLEQANVRVNLDCLEGLGFHDPWLGISVTVLVLSAAGIPPLAGFVAKYFLFLDVVRNGHVTSVVIAVISSLISLYYYLRILVLMFMKEPQQAVALPKSRAVCFVSVVIALCLIFLGLFPVVLR